MKEEKKAEKKGLLQRLFGGGKQGPCCCSVQIEEIPEEDRNAETETKEDTKS